MNYSKQPDGKVSTVDGIGDNALRTERLDLHELEFKKNYPNIAYKISAQDRIPYQDITLHDKLYGYDFVECKCCNKWKDNGNICIEYNSNILNPDSGKWKCDTYDEIIAQTSYTKEDLKDIKGLYHQDVYLAYIYYDKNEQKPPKSKYAIKYYCMKELRKWADKNIDQCQWGITRNHESMHISLLIPYKLFNDTDLEFKTDPYAKKNHYKAEYEILKKDLSGQDGWIEIFGLDGCQSDIKKMNNYKDKYEAERSRLEEMNYPMFQGGE